MVFGDVTSLDSLRQTAFSQPVDVVVSCLASRTGGKKDSWDIDYQVGVHLCLRVWDDTCVIKACEATVCACSVRVQCESLCLCLCLCCVCLSGLCAEVGWGCAVVVCRGTQKGRCRRLLSEG